MIANQLKNRSFRSTLEYALEKEEAEIIDSNMGGYNPRQLAREFGAARRMRPNFQRACGHIILSLPHREASHPQGEYHEHLDDEKYALIARRWLKEMQFLGDGLHKSQYVIARHQDTDHEHIHIIASRIRMDGSVVPDSWDYRRSEVVVRQLEQEFGLEPTRCSNERVAQKVKQKLNIETTVGERSAQTKKQKHHFSGKPPVKQLLADAIDEATSDQPTVTELIARLQQQDITVHPSFSTKGKFKNAIAFSMNGVKMAGWKLGKAYSFPGLQRRKGVDYNLERDIPALRAARDGQLVKLSVPPHDKTDKSSSSSSNLDSNNQPSAQDKEPNTPQETNQQQVIDNELNTTQENIYYQQKYAAKIAPTIRQFWEINKRPKSIKGNHYSITLEEGILKLSRRSGKKIADIPTDNSTAPQGFDLNESDIERFVKLQRILNNHKSQTQRSYSKGFER
ncbi:relaxase/mobilization nuclease domain-containing protein [Rivularia sp. UHCC 0363]|uniref:relaxase/mobilization nuclease domain-containing protein n=1 Tax=Rivularia sp. UHCC 0363 TaxID=3110244 RepID=UPI002B20E806|nr:relaxase/mobilization nuclease domain-containing protein [Rivularia sp. UHCC 0363]MEA5599261.1 relaxase/mobilization nuclease domain-containing protein [Rivularia sp. UHCC 0363]